MNDTNDTEDVESYILSSTYRSRVLEYLAGTVRATPTEIANDVGASRSHISRALSELQEKDVVELRVSEAQTVGRYYGLTEKGEEAWPRIKRAVRNVEWTVREPSMPEMDSIVELAQDEFGDSLRCVGRYDGDEVTICYIDPEVQSEYSDEEFEEALRTLIFDLSIDETAILNEECWSELLHFQDLSILRVRVPDGSRVALSFGTENRVESLTISESVQSIFEQ